MLVSFTKKTMRRNILPVFVIGLLAGVLASCSGGGAGEGSQLPSPSMPLGTTVTLAPARTAGTASAETNISIPQQPAGALRLAVIGDYGAAGKPEQEVAALVAGWKPAYVLTVGDNNYPSGAAATIDRNIGQYYRQFIGAYRGAYGAGAASNRFFPALGNHDWASAGARPYLDYFTLPGNERYYTVDLRPVRLFVVDSDPQEPDGVKADSTQAAWLQRELATSTACWNLVTMHHPPYSSATHGSSDWMQWPYRQWKADVVLAGHDHTYERIVKDGLPYFVNGLGGRSIYNFKTPLPESQARYNAGAGAMLIEASPSAITFQFIARTGAVIDRYTLQKQCG